MVVTRVIPQHYPVEEGKIYGGEYPGARSPEYAAARVGHLVEKGIRTFVDLTSAADDMAPYDDVLSHLADESGLPLKRISIPVPDMGVPHSEETMRKIIQAIRESVDAGLPVYIHCWGGIGRTGTAVGCWLRESGMDGRTALDEVQKTYSKHMQKARYHPESPQTAGQRKYVLNWKPAGSL